MEKAGVLENLWLGHSWTMLQEVEVGSFMSLGDVFDVELRITTVITWWRGLPGLPTFGQLFIGDMQM
jgi:hypothetical protein